MQFSDKQPIYLQIADYISERILTGQWSPGERIPSVRDLGTELEVNPNTAIRAYDYLQQQGIIFNKRGIGYFTADDAPDRVRTLRRDHFLQTALPDFFRTMTLLGLTMDDIAGQYVLFQQAYLNDRVN